MSHATITAVQVTFTQPPPNGSVVIPNQQLQNVTTVTSSLIDNPGNIPSGTVSTFPYGIADVYTVNQKLSQFFPVNAPPKA